MYKYFIEIRNSTAYITELINRYVLLYKMIETLESNSVPQGVNFKALSEFIHPERLLDVLEIELLSLEKDIEYEMSKFENRKNSQPTLTK